MTPRRSLVLATGLALGVTGSVSAVTVPVGQSQTVTLEASSYSSDLVVDIPAPLPAERVRVRWVPAAGSSGDVDLFLRYDSPIPTHTVYGASLPSQAFTEYAHFSSTSATDEEAIVLTSTQRFPLKPGRLFATLVNHGNSAAQGTLVVETVGPDDHGRFVAFYEATSDCAIEPWSDPVLGAVRRADFERALSIATEQLRPAGDIAIRGCWFNTPTTPELMAIGFPSQLLVSGVASLPATLTPLANYLPSSVPANLAHAMGVVANFNGTGSTFLPGVTNVGRVTLNPATAFRYSDGRNPTGFDFTTVVLHELAHTLGLTTAVKSTPAGARISPFDIGFHRSMAIVAADGSVTPFDDATDSARVDAYASGDRLRWIGPEGVLHPNNAFAGDVFPSNTLRLLASSASPSTSGSHLADGFHANELLTAQFPASLRAMDYGLAQGMLRDFGWGPTDFTAPPAVVGGQWYDPNAGLGRGFDLRKVGGREWFGVWYTYTDDGKPTWFTSFGDTVDGRFIPALDPSGNDLSRTVLNPDSQAVLDPSSAYKGYLRLATDMAGISPACRASHAGQSANPALAVLTTQTGDTVANSCVERLVLPSPSFDHSGLWFAPSDPGWGISILSYGAGNGVDGISGQIYFFDGNGEPRWAFFQTDRFVDGEPIALQEVTNGPCPTCTAPAALETVSSGTLRLTLSTDTPTAVVDVGYSGTPSSRFRRDKPIVRGSE